MIDAKIISQALMDHFRTRDEGKAYLETARLLAIQLGMDDKDAKSGREAIAYLDGWLAGQGSLPQSRR